MVAMHPVGIAVLVCVVGLAASQPFPHTHNQQHKHTSDFKWNSRRVGNKKVATLTIRKDEEERDRRSIPLTGDDDSEGKKPHCHRHHHGDNSRSEVWTDDREATRREEGLIRNSRGLTPRFLSDLEDRPIRHSRLNDVYGESEKEEKLDEAALFLNQIQPGNTTRRQRNGNGGRRRRKNRNRNGKRRRKSSKGCKRLKGRMKRICRAALQKCKNLKGREKRRCRESATDSVPKDNDNNVFSFIKGKNLMLGNDACQYRYLKLCSKKVGMLNDHSANIKCYLRDRFLKCMDEQRQKSCDPDSRIRGNMTAIRKKIREVVWTRNSCLVTEAVEG